MVVRAFGGSTAVGDGYYRDLGEYMSSMGIVRLRYSPVSIGSAISDWALCFRGVNLVLRTYVGTQRGVLIYT